MMLLKRNGFKTLEAIAEFIMYVPWMFYLYFFIFRDSAFFKFIPFLIAFLVMGLFVTDYLIAKRGFIYKIVAYTIGIVPAVVIAGVLWVYMNSIFASIFALYFLICYMRGLAFAICNFKVAYNQFKFIFGMAVLMLAFILSLYIKDLNWFGSYIIWMTLSFIAISIVILNQLQLIYVLDMMNAEAYATHKDVRLRNFIFSLIIIGLIMLIFEFKTIVRFLSWLSVFMISGLRYVMFTILRWLISWFNNMPYSYEEQAAPPMDFSQLQGGASSPLADVIRMIMEWLSYALVIVIAAFLVYRVGRALIKWISTLMQRYTIGDDEERKFIISWEDLTVRSLAVGQSMRQRIRHIIRRFETPQQRVRFLYAQVIKWFTDKGYGFKPSDTPQEIHSYMSQRLPAVDPALMDITTLYQQARYSHHDIKDEHVSRAKKYRDQLFKLKL